MPPPDAERAVPASLGCFRDSRLPAIVSAVRADRALETVGRIVAHDRWNSFDRFHQTGRLLLSSYEACGAGAELYTIPTGGVRGDGGWVIPEAQDVHDATLDLIAPVPLRLADYRQCPWHVVQWTAATPPDGLTGELVVIDSPEQLAAAAPDALAGRIVLTRLSPWENRSKFLAAGAAGVVCDPPVPGCPGAVAWAKFGWGGVGLWDGGTPLVGFCIAAEIGDELRELHRRHGRLVVRARVDARRYAGSHGVVSGLIPGRDDPQAEVWAVAHSSEPGALDNASGVAACVEIARVLTDLIRGGLLPPPRRTIRLLHGYECYGFFQYLQRRSREDGGRPPPPLAGVCIDTIGARPDLCGGVLRWHATAPGSAPFADDVGEVLLRAALAAGPPVYRLQRMPFVSTEDTLLGDPQFGFPCPWLTNHPFPGYHSSADTIEKVDGPGLAACAAAMAAYLYWLADAGTDEALELARWQTDRALARLAVAGQADSWAGRESVRHAHAMTIERLRRFVWAGDHATLTREFDGHVARVAGAAGAGHGKAPENGGRPAAVPRRRRPLGPTPENVWPHVHGRLGTSFPKWAAYWADGERSVAEFAALAAPEAGDGWDEARVARHLEILAELGYVELIDPADFVTEDRLAGDFAALGVRAGTDVMVHSSLKSIGPVRGGGAAVVRALLSVLGPGGTLLAPSFNHFQASVFNPLTTPTTNGAIPDALWRRADALRSLHPSHSVAAVGARAAEYVRDHLGNGIWAENSPIGRLIHGGGFLLSIGVGHDRSTAYHVAEISLGVPCLDQFGSADRVVAADGRVEAVRGLAWRAEECPAAPEEIGAMLDAGGLQRHGRVGRAAATLARAFDVWSLRREQLGDRCACCPIRPHRRNGLVAGHSGERGSGKDERSS